MSYFQAIPPGFYAANEILCHLPDKLIQVMVNETLQSLSEKVGVVSAKRLLNRLKDLEPESEFTEDHIQSALNATAFLINGAISQKLDPESFNKAIRVHAQLDDEPRKIFVTEWMKKSANGKLILSSASSSDSSASVAATMRLGRLIGFEWKLGIGVSSSHCKSLKEPFVCLELNVANHSGHVTAYPMELTIPEFKKFVKNFREIKSILETV